MNVAIQTGDISRHILEAESDRRLTRHKKDAIVRKAQQAVRELVFLMSDVENRCGGAGPFVSMCADAVMNGLPIPGM
ncbi:phage regulatory CII family protein [Moritella viscosa]|uniref:Possible phage regulatory protein (CII) n=1 Tax=Moritella viscosa TaxID=80854 RepID=A0A1L0B9A9_9GAMM|nr:phage regulatory CII family protein [Moritella viscosa]SGY93681.1 Possible phage regulatory protein (CII) [Moritella viscosa]